jgi:tetratricopeptide (TPR) repeat protein
MIRFGISSLLFYWSIIASLAQHQRLPDYTNSRLDSASDPDIKRGLLSFDKDEPERAHKYFTIALKRYPKNFLLYEYRGMADLKMGRNTAAIQEFSNAIELNSNDANLWKLRAMVFREIGDFRSALNDFDKAISLDGANDSYYYYRGSVGAQMGSYSKSLSDLNEAYKLHKPKDDDRALAILRERAEVKTMLRQYQGAISDFHHYLALKGENIRAYFFCGKAFLGLHSHDGRRSTLDSAVFYFKKYKLLSGSVRDGMSELALAYAISGDSIKAKLEMSIIKTAKSDPRHWLTVAACEFALGNSKKGKDALSAVLSLQPSGRIKALAYYNLAWSYSLSRDSAHAYQDFQLAQNADSTLNEIYEARSYASLWFFNSDIDLLKNDLDKVLTNASGNPEKATAIYFLSFAALRNKQFAEAMSFINRAIDLNPADASFYELRAFIRISSGQENVDDVLADLNKAICIDPSYRSAYIQKGLALAVYKKAFTDACSLWDQAIALGSKIPDNCRNALCKENTLIPCDIAFGPEYKKPAFIY